MSKVTDIKTKILQMDPGRYQEFCDTFLSKKNEYVKILGLGMKSGTHKTTTGNPDTYFRQDNGKYVFVAYTTQQSGIYTKIKDDIDKCLDIKKTGVELEYIEEIICCHTSSNLTAGEDQKLHDYCMEKGIKLTIYGIDEMAQQIYNQYKSLATELGVPLDTNQIMSKEEFIKQYDANEMAAPLDTIFQFRECELKQLISAISCNKAVIIYGKAGIGKTRIALEAVSCVAKKEGYHLLCVKNNNLGLYDDLVCSIEKPGKYLFFVDDANELNQLGQILEYTKRIHDGYFVKIVVTVRDYVKTEVLREIYNYTKPNLIKINKFSDEEISSFLEINMGIHEKEFVSKIIRISEGNPRIAYMAGKLVKENKSLESIRDASQLYDNYYSTYIESTIGTDEKLCFSVGIIALFGKLVLDRLEGLDQLLEIGDISKEEFIRNINKLSKMEYVEIKSNKVAFVSDQCLANYMIYYVFVQHKLISISQLIKIGFTDFRSRLIQSLNTLLNIFYNDDTKLYIEEEINSIWDEIKLKGEDIYDEFVKVFRFIRPEEAFAIAYEKIENIPTKHFDALTINYRNNKFWGNYILELLSGHRNPQDVLIVLELLFKYIVKSKENAENGYQWMKRNFEINHNSIRNNFSQENIIAKYVYEHCIDNEVVTNFCLAWSSHMLGFEYHFSEEGRGNKISMFTVKIFDEKPVRLYREYYWNCLEKVLQTENYSEKIFIILEQYAILLRNNKDKQLAMFDQYYVLNILKQMPNDGIKKQLVLRELIFSWKKINIVLEKTYYDIFKNYEWELYTTLLENKCFYTDIPYKEYSKIRKNNLIKFATDLKNNDIAEFIKKVNKIIKDNFVEREKSSELYHINNAIQIILEQFCCEGDKSFSFFKAYMDFGEYLNINPFKLFQKLFDKEDPENIYLEIFEHSFPQKNYWLFVFFEALPEKLVDEKYYSYFIGFISDDSDKKISHSTFRTLRVLDKFRIVHPEVYVDVSRVIINKRKYSDFIVCIYFEVLFYKDNYMPSELLMLYKSDINTLKKIYFYMLEKGKFVDLEGEFLVKFIETDESFLESYNDYFWKTKNMHEYEYQIFALWKSDSYEKYWDYIFYHRPSNNDEFYWENASVFGKALVHTEDNIMIVERQKNWILHIIEDNADNHNIYSIFYIICDLSEEIRKNAIEKFLSCNCDYSVFEKISIEPTLWSWSGSEISLINRRIHFLKSLLPYMNELKLLSHKSLIKSRILALEKRIKAAEIDDLCRSLYM